MRRRSFGQPGPIAMRVVMASVHRVEQRAHDLEVESPMYSLFMAPDTSPNREEVRQNPRHARSIAIALVLALLVAACSSDTATSEDSGETATTTTAASPDTTAAEDAGGVLTLQFAAVPEGMWRVESLGTPFDIDIEGDWWVQPNEPGWAVFTDPDSSGPGDRDVVFIRPTAISDPTDPSATGEDWPVDDIEGWLEAIIDGVVVTEPVDAEIGGAEGIVFEVELAGSQRVEFVENSDVSGKTFDPSYRYIVYWLDQGEHEPIAIIVGARNFAIDDWALAAESLLANVTFDEPAPHPSA